MTYLVELTVPAWNYDTTESRDMTLVVDFGTEEQFGETAKSGFRDLTSCLSENWSQVEPSAVARILGDVQYTGSETVHVYYGLGGQVNSRSYYPDNKRTLPSPGDRERPISLGGSAIGGFEYFIPDNKISVFLEGGVYVELLPRPFYLSPNLSAGIRFNL